MERTYKAGLAALAFTACLFATGANANTITMDNYNGGPEDLDCTPSCLGFIGVQPNISLSGTNADDYSTADSSEAAELALLNALLADLTPARGPVVFKNKDDNAGDSFSTDRQYFSIKQSNEIWYFENTSGGSVSVDLGDDTNDFSHWTEFGPVVVPLPAAAWLFGSALLGLVGISRRRDRAKAA